jgi:hypothetical protein
MSSYTAVSLADVLPNPQHALWTIIISYVLWGTGMPFALMVLVNYFQRPALYKLPSREVIVSVFLPVGPFGQGGYGYAPIPWLHIWILYLTI